MKVNDLLLISFCLIAGKFSEIEKQNRILLEKMASIMQDDRQQKLQN